MYRLFIHRPNGVRWSLANSFSGTFRQTEWVCNNNSMDINASRISLCTPNDFAVLQPATEGQISAIRRIAVMDELGCVISTERLHILDCDRFSC